MKEQKRIFELVKQGIITSEEAIELLESLNDKNTQNETDDSQQTITEEVNKFKNYAKDGTYNEEPLADKLDLEGTEEVNESDSDQTVGKKVSEYFKSVYNSSKIKEGNKIQNSLSNRQFTHEFYYPEVSSTVIDFKIANGMINLLSWDELDLKMAATIKLYGNMKATTNLEAFLERSQIDVTDDKISFQVPNKRVKVDIDVYLPKKVYDHVSIKLLNGDISMDNISANDLFIKSTNGDKNLNSIKATMLEIQGVNGNVFIENSDINDIISEVVNGNSDIRGDFHSLSITKSSGDFLLKPSGANLKNVDAKIDVGTIRLTVPQLAGLEAQLKTNFGSIRQKNSRGEIVRERKEKTMEQLHLRQSNQGVETIHLRLNTTTGNIYIKDEVESGIN